MKAFHNIDNVGALREALADLPSTTPVVQVNPVGQEDFVDVFITDESGTLRVLIFEG